MTDSQGPLSDYEEGAIVTSKGVNLGIPVFTLRPHIWHSERAQSSIRNEHTTDDNEYNHEEIADEIRCPSSVSTMSSKL
jgi:hypothetical protein